MTELVFDKKDVFSWANAEDAKRYIGKEGYFASHYCNDLKSWWKAKLLDINRDGDISNVFIGECDDVEKPYFGDDEDCAGLFLPADKVKRVEKKWRPFKTIEEFKRVLDIKLGSVLVYRRKDESDMEFVAAFMGYKRLQPTGSLYSVLLGGMTYLVVPLLDKYEWYNTSTNEWCPFGVEE